MVCELVYIAFALRHTLDDHAGELLVDVNHNSLVGLQLGPRVVWIVLEEYLR